MNDTRYGLTAGVYTRDEARAATHPGAGQRRQRLLELLRPRQPAPAVVGAWRFGRRPDAVDLRHPGVHAAAAPGTCARLERRRLGVRGRAAAGAVRPRRHAARRRHRRAVVRLPDRRGRARSRHASPPPTATVAERYARGAIAPAEFAAFYAATLAGRTPRAMAAAARALRRDRDRAAHRRGVACPRRAASRRRRPPRPDDRDQPLPHRRRSLLCSGSTSSSRPSSSRTRRAASSPAGSPAPSNMREGKVTRLREWLAAQGLGETASLAAATFYSDSINDLPLLLAVGTPVAVDPDARLRRGGRAAALAGDLAARLIDRVGARAHAIEAARQTSDAPLPSSRIQIVRAAWRGSRRRCRWLPMK